MKSLPDTSPSGAFTMIETIVVLVLVSIIVGVFILRGGGLGNQKRIETARGDLRALQTGIHAYYLNHSNTYPAGADWQSNDLVNDNPRVLRQVLYDPFRAANTEYSYFVSSNGKYYAVFSYGPDGATDITGINNSGQLTGADDDDISLSNGTGTFV